MRVERHGARLELRELEQLLDEPAEPLDLPERGLQRRALDGLDPVDEVLEQGPERADGGAELVGDVRDEVLAHPVHLFELGGHGVEGARELADLVARAWP